MKKQFFRTAAMRRTVGKFVVTAFIVVTGFAANAQVSQVKQEIKTTSASVKYIGGDEELMSFVVKYENAGGDKMDVAVIDNEGIPLYKNVFTDKHFHKTFVLPRSGNSKVKFVIKNVLTGEVNSFEANTKVVEEVVVKRVG